MSFHISVGKQRTYLAIQTTRHLRKVQWLSNIDNSFLPSKIYTYIIHTLSMLIHNHEYLLTLCFRANWGITDKCVIYFWSRTTHLAKEIQSFEYIVPGYFLLFAVHTHPSNRFDTVGMEDTSIHVVCYQY